MPVVFDTTSLLHLLDPNLNPLEHPKGTLIAHTQARISGLVADLHQAKQKIILPTPALSELLVLAGPAGAEYLTKISKASAFRIEPFDQRAAIELAIMTRDALKAGDRKAGSTASVAKVKFDRQIIAIAAVNRATAIYSDDENLKKFAEARGIKVFAVWDYPSRMKAANMTC